MVIGTLALVSNLYILYSEEGLSLYKM